MSSMTGSRVDMRPGPPSMPQSMHRRPTKRQAPQKGIDDLWDAFTTKYPGKVLSILPKNAYAKSKAAREPKGITHSQDVSTSYEEAKDKCIRTVAQITKECRRVNIRYRDPHFDIEFDLKRATRNCLDGITDYNDAAAPKAVKRVPVQSHCAINFALTNTDI